MLQITDLSVTYGGALTALHKVTLAVPDGGVVALLGSNGAGKTTLLRAVSNNLKRHRGKITSGKLAFNGIDLQSKDTAALVSNGVVQVPEGRRIFGRLTVEENLRVGGLRQAKGQAAKARDHVYELFPRLQERRNQRGLLLSGGEQQMLAIGRALMASPKLLMLDEPSLGLAPLVVSQVGDVIKAINEQGTSILIIEQNANMALSVADYAYVLETGRVSLHGEAQELAATDEIKHLYLGHGGGGNDDLAAPALSLAGKTLKPWSEES
ncbi:ABC transporter ATP-binding protein [Arthrobacter crystallopoietes]|uniref:Amino acid/amide ABC transporter ATP-binding protein 2, HAAT family n=1 Tax=Crystallibacter crystallopoietes TaxID=37928 RepID=A0A1H1CV23_9MICC|nr:ABC transporter ATP-binding protein [Arthrobacter crystallopoietes]AUI50604.1 ABC transporter ATP-binding protein [Arthrobacter crystallopoietes]SDQ67748.1 amino acid/amide ABC transporter ATP-binding protein 2, HAAT family [Arthrobacter crystallopoietes]